MGARLRPRVVLAAALLAGLSLVAGLTVATASNAAPPSPPMSRDEVDRVALAALAPGALPNRVVISGLDAVLARGTLLGQSGPATKAEARITKNKAGLSVARKMRPVALPSDAWVVWMDLAPGAYFAHPSVLLAVDARKGRIVRRLQLLWAPEINRRPALFTRTLYAPPVRSPVSAALTLSPQVMSELAPSASRLSQWFIGAQGGPPQETGRFAKECIVVLRDPHDALFEPSDKLIDDLARRLAVRKQNAATKVELKKAVAALTTNDPRCTDVVVWVLAHGYPAPGAKIATPSGTAIEKERPTVNLGSAQGDSSVETVFSSDDFRETMAMFPETTFKLVLDVCFAGRWVEDFAGNDPKAKGQKRPKNLRVVVASSNSAEMSFSYGTGERLPKAAQSQGTITEIDPGHEYEYKGENLKSKAGWFTFHMVAGVEKWIGEPDGSNDLGKGLERGFDLGTDDDFMAQLGLTHPTALREGELTPSPPRVAPMPLVDNPPPRSTDATPSPSTSTAPSTSTSAPSTTTSTTTTSTTSTTTTISSAVIVVGATGPGVATVTTLPAVVATTTVPASTSTTSPPSSSTTSSTTTLPASTTTTGPTSTTTTVPLAAVISVVANVCVLHAAVDSLLRFLISVTVGGVPASGVVMSSISGGGVNRMPISLPLDGTGMTSDSVVITQQAAYTNQVSYGAATLTTNFTVGPHTNPCPATAA